MCVCDRWTERGPERERERQRWEGRHTDRKGWDELKSVNT